MARRARARSVAGPRTTHRGALRRREQPVSARRRLRSPRPLVGARAPAADPRAVLAACEQMNRERLPEVRLIQRLQQLPPRFLFRRSALSRFLVRWLIPGLARSGIVPLLAGFAARRFLFGTTEVRL